MDEARWNRGLVYCMVERNYIKRTEKIPVSCAFFLEQLVLNQSEE